MKDKVFGMWRRTAESWTRLTLRVRQEGRPTALAVLASGPLFRSLADVPSPEVNTLCGRLCRALPWLACHTAVSGCSIATFPALFVVPHAATNSGTSCDLTSGHRTLMHFGMLVASCLFSARARFGKILQLSATASNIGNVWFTHPLALSRVSLEEGFASDRRSFPSPCSNVTGRRRMES